MKQRIYIETTIVSYLTSKPSRDRIAAGHQAATELWWHQYRPKCELFISEVVAMEAREGDPEASRRRAAAIAGIPLLAVTDEVSSLAKRLVKANALPTTAEDDALHVALASVFEIRCAFDLELSAYRQRNSDAEDTCYNRASRL